MTEKPTTAWPLTPDGRHLMLRTCAADLTSHGGFQWPTVGGTAAAPDWDPDPHRGCGGGLHGLPWGCGDAVLLGGHARARWLVVAVDPADVANIDAPGKVRFRAGEVLVDTADRDEAIAYLVDNGAQWLPVVYGTATAGDYGTATAGYRGTATAGDYGTATAGDRGTATAGDYGTATAGDGGRLLVTWWDTNAVRYRTTIGYVGEDGIKASTPHRCDTAGKLVEVAQ